MSDLQSAAAAANVTSEFSVPPVKSAELWQLIYLSVARHKFTSPELTELLAKARVKNQALDVTGMLVYRDRCFLQVLEGPHTVVANLFTTIGRDPRHAEVSIAHSGPILIRSFEDWRMGYFDGRNGELPPGLVDFFGDCFSPAMFAHNADFARQMLLAFRDTKWRKFVDEA